MSELVCDLGGTSCRMAMAENGKVVPDTCQRMQNAAFDCFEDVLSAYLASQGGDAPVAVIIALAAPVTGDCIELTNLHWRLSKSKIAAMVGTADVHFINDLEALGHALSDAERLRTLPILPGGPIAKPSLRLVLGVGTGFNSAACNTDGTVICSETGHTTFPVETELDRWLQADFTARFGRCSLERVLSGSGVAAVYRGVCALNGVTPQLPDSTKIMPAAISGDDPLAHQTCDELCRILGRSAGDLALTFMALGGVWLAGGVTRALTPFLSDPQGAFSRAFLAKGRMSEEIAVFPVHLLDDDNAALQGCVSWLQQHRGQLTLPPRHAPLENERID